jgi:hypothetical protein
MCDQECLFTAPLPSNISPTVVTRLNGKLFTKKLPNNGLPLVACKCVAGMRLRSRCLTMCIQVTIYCKRLLKSQFKVGIGDPKSSRQQWFYIRKFISRWIRRHIKWKKCVSNPKRRTEEGKRHPRRRLSAHSSHLSQWQSSDVMHGRIPTLEMRRARHVSFYINQKAMGTQLTMLADFTFALRIRRGSPPWVYAIPNFQQPTEIVTWLSTYEFRQLAC